jgi:hypothetical protein
MFCEVVAPMRNDIAVAKEGCLDSRQHEPMFSIVFIRHVKEVKMPSPRKAPPSHEAETETPSRKKEVAEPSKSLGKTQGHKDTQGAKRTKSKSRG